MVLGYIEGDYLYFDAPDATTASEICKAWDNTELEYDDLTTADYIELFNLMNNRYTQGNRLVFPNTNGAITTEFKDFRDFAERVRNGDYHSNDSWCQINAHGNIITFTELEDSEINVLHIKEWLERSQENRDLANTKLGKNRF